MKTILLTGSGGFLGTHFYNLLHQQYNVVGIYNNTINNSIAESYKTDITNTAALNTIVEKIQPNIIVHTAAISSIAACEQNEAIAYATNVTASIQLAILAKQYNAQFLFCSTDLVFDGTKGNYSEEDLPNPLNKYAEQKYIAEQKIRQVNNNAIIARLPLMIGENKNSFAGVVAEMQQYNKEQKPMHLFTNEYRTPALVQDVVSGLQLLIEKKCTGIYHIAGNQKLNRLQIAQYVKAKYNLENIALIPTTHQEKNITNRPTDVSLCIAKMEQLGYRPTLLVYFFKQLLCLLTITRRFLNRF